MLLSQMADSRKLSPPTTSLNGILSQGCGNASVIGAGVGGKHCGGGSDVYASCVSRHRPSQSHAVVDDVAKDDFHLQGPKEKQSGTAWWGKCRLRHGMPGLRNHEDSYFSMRGAVDVDASPCPRPPRESGVCDAWMNHPRHGETSAPTESRDVRPRDPPVASLMIAATDPRLRRPTPAAPSSALCACACALASRPCHASSALHVPQPPPPLHAPDALHVPEPRALYVFRRRRELGL